MQDALRRRELSDTSRAGRYARGLVWDQQLSYAKRAWWYLVVIFVSSLALAAPIFWALPSPWEWLVAGAGVATGFWLVVMNVLLESGAASTLMGVSGEETTVLFLQDLRRRGWRIVNGLMIREKADIDHVAVGPAGVLVIETKWSADAWPIGVPGKSFMRDTLDRAVDQARRNAKDVAIQFKKELGAVLVRPVVVAWSRARTDDGGPDWIDQDGVTVVQGRMLSKWLETLEAQGLDEEPVTRIWSALVKQTDTRDSRMPAPRPTLHQIASRVFQQVPAGGAAAWAFVAIIHTMLPAWAMLSAVVVAAVIGFRVPRTSILWWAARGWSWTMLILLAFVAVYVVGGLLR